MKGLGWDEENWESRSDFHKELCFMSKILGISQSRIHLDVCHPVGEVVIFIDGHYNGYLDPSFYDFMEHGLDPYNDYADWIKRWRNKK